jgi:hypothetical protein
MATLRQKLEGFQVKKRNQKDSISFCNVHRKGVEFVVPLGAVSRRFRELYMDRNLCIFGMEKRIRV